MIQAPAHRCFFFPLALFVFLFLRVAQCQNCYWPDGTAAGSMYAPCPGTGLNGGKGGGCCYSSGPSLSDLCYSNGFCYSVVLGKIYRGACTEQGWGAGSGCAAQCLNTNADNTIDVSPCLDTKICCGSGDNVTSCCAAGNGFPWSNATFLGRDTAVTTTTATTTATSTVTVLATGTSTALGQTSPSPSGAASCHSQSIALGAGLGVPLGLALLLAAFLASRVYRPSRSGTAGSSDQKTATVQRFSEKKIRPEELGGSTVTELPVSDL